MVTGTVSDILGYEEIEHGDVLIFVVKDKKNNNKAKKAIFQNLVDGEELIKQYVSGNDSLYRYVFDTSVKDIIPKINPSIKQEYYIKYEKMNENIKTALIYLRIRSGSGIGEKEIDSIINEDIKNFLMAFNEYNYNSYEKAESYILKCKNLEDDSSFKLLKADIFFMLKKYDGLVSIYEQLKDEGHCSFSKLVKVYDETGESIKAAELCMENEYYASAIAIYVKLQKKENTTKYIEKMIECYSLSYEIRANKDFGMVLVKLLLQVGRNEEALRWMEKITTNV